MKVNILPRQDWNNGWLQILPALPPAKVAQGTIKADVAVIGAGYVGLAAARRLGQLWPDKSIVLIEAGRVGNNSAGRSSGFAIDQAHNIRSKSYSGDTRAEKEQIALNRAGQDFLREAVQAHGIDCDWEESGKVHGAGTERGVESLAAYARQLDALGLTYSRLDAAGMKGLTGSGFYRAGLHTPGTIMLQPAKLVLGLAAHLPPNLTLYEDSPVGTVDYGSPHVLTTPEASILAGQVLLTNNLFAGQFGFYRDSLIPVMTWGSLTRELTPAEQAALGGQETWALIPADPSGTSARRIRGNRILIRNIYSYSARLNPEERDRQWARQRHMQSLKNRFPMLPGLELEYTWGGPMSLSRNGNPVFGTLGTNVYGAFCCNGIGIARGTAYGMTLAEHVAGESGPLLDIMRNAGRPDKLPPQPFLGWGVQYNLAARRRKAGLEL